MKGVLGGKYVPITFSIGFLQAPYSVVVDSFVAWRAETHPKIATSAKEGSLSRLLQALEPLSMPPCRDLLVSTRGHWTAFFDNSAKIPDVASPVGYMCTRIKCRGLAISCVPDTINLNKHGGGTYGVVAFTLFSPEQREFLNRDRTIVAINDGGRWRFIADGTIQNFEEVDAYKNKTIRNRLTPEMVERYCQALGISLFDEEFYGPNALVVETIYPPSVTRDMLVMSLPEAQRELLPRKKKLA